VHDVILFEDIGNGQTKLTFIGMNPWRARKIAVKWRTGTRYSIKFAAVVAGLMQAK
jgi:hypothetical protein